MTIGSMPARGGNNLEGKKQQLAQLKQRFAGLNEQQKLLIFKALLPREAERIQAGSQAEWNSSQESASEDDFFRNRSGWTTPVSYSAILEGGQYDAELLENLEKFESLLPVSSIESKGWSVEVLEQVKDIQPSQFHPEKKWMATHFKIERPDGSIEEVESTKIILKIKSKDGIDIEVPAFAVNHIMSLHLKGEEAGGVMEGSLESSFGVVSEHLPKELPFKGESAAFEVDTKQNTGTEGVSSQKEMMEKGIVSKEDLEILAGAKDEVFRLNIEGTDEEKKKFVDGFNSKLSGNVKLGIRGGAITPFFTADRQPTTQMFMVVGKEKDADGSEHNRVWTMTPGRYMDKLPTDGQFTGRYSGEGIPEGTTVADLWKKLKSGEKLSSQEVSLIDAQKKAQECWWNGGFIVAPEKK
ncbi:MAG: hypothetical protein WC783_01270 [Candidatus Paceibacterota bacterium]|jgi:hypothetical protein